MYCFSVCERGGKMPLNGIVSVLTTPPNEKTPPVHSEQDKVMGQGKTRYA